MDNSLKQTLKTLEKITDLRYRSEQGFIDILQSQLEKSSNESFRPLVNGGVNFLNSALENRHDLELSVLRKIKREVEKKSDGSTGSDTPTEPVTINSGTFMVKTFLSQKKVQIPLNINNNYDDPQEVIVDLEELKNMRSGDPVKNKITADRTVIMLPPKKSAQLKIEIDISSGFKVQDQYFTTFRLRGKETRVFQIILEILSAKNKKAKASLTFLPPSQ